MGIKDFIEDAAGAIAAEQGLEKLDPNANLLEEGAALVAGYEGTGLLKDKLGELLGEHQQEDAAAQDTPQDDDQDAPQDSGQDNDQDDSQNG